MIRAFFKNAKMCFCNTTRNTYYKTKSLCPLKLIRSVPIPPDAPHNTFEEIEMRNNGLVQRRIPSEFIIP